MVEAVEVGDADTPSESNLLLEVVERWKTKTPMMGAARAKNRDHQTAGTVMIAKRVAQEKKIPSKIAIKVNRKKVMSHLSLSQRLVRGVADEVVLKGAKLCLSLTMTKML